MLISLQILLLIENNYKVLETFQNIVYKYFETLESTSGINLWNQPLESTSGINLLDYYYKNSYIREHFQRFSKYPII
jgi:hypothetical protein